MVTIKELKFLEVRVWLFQITKLQASLDKIYNIGHPLGLKDPIHFFFIERYAQAYKDQFNDFVKCVSKKTKPKVTFEDGRNALIIANAAYESYKKGKVVNIRF